MIPEYRNRILPGDVEADNLLDNVKQVWCIVSMDHETKELYLFHDHPEFDGTVIIDAYDGKEYTIPTRTGSLSEGAEFWSLAGKHGSKLVVHNALGYDKFIMEKFFPEHDIPSEAWHDTLIQSKVQWYDRKTPKGCKGAHGLQAYGARFGINKPEIHDWSYIDAFKLHRCIEDVKIQDKTYEYLEKERTQALDRYGIDINGSFETESEYRIGVTRQELTGFLADKTHMEECCEELDELIENLRKTTEPLLPKHYKVKSTKVTSHECAKLLGVRNPPPIRYDHEFKEIKRMYKPVTKWTKAFKQNKYQIEKDGEYVSGSDGNPLTFDKLKEARDYAKANLDGTKGCAFRKEICEGTVLNAVTCSYFDIEPDSDLIAGPFTKIEWCDTRLTQQALVKKYLLSLGWEPTEWNVKKGPDGKVKRDRKGNPEKSSPKLTEDSFESLPEGVGRHIANYNTYTHRRRFIANPHDQTKGILHMVRPDGRVPGGVMNFGTSTGRAAHKNWVNAPGVGALYGEKCRQIVIAPEGHKLVGADMKSAQLSIAAYYANNYDYYMAVADGQEEDQNGNYIGESGHCVNARAFTLVTEEEWKRAIQTQDKDLLHSISLRRKKSKGGTFATIFGASGKKVGKTLGIPEELGNEKKKAFLEAIGLDEPIARLKRMAAKYKRGQGGYIELPFGVWVWCAEEHKLFNYLDQGTEAICQKVAVNYYEREAKKLGLDACKILDYHK